MKKKRILLGALGVLFVSSCGGSGVTYVGEWYSSGTYYAMDYSPFTFHLGRPLSSSSSSSSSGSSLTAKALGDIITHYDQEGSNTMAVSGLNNVYAINQTNAPVVVDDDLLELLKLAQEMQSVTGGYFNPLMGQLSALWKSALKMDDAAATDYALPDSATVASYLEEAKATTLTIVDHTVTRTGKGLLDLGAIAKGFAMEKCRQAIQQAGLKYYLLDGAASSIVLGENITSESTFNVGFNPSELQGKKIVVKDCVITTSGTDVQYREIDGKLYSHIVNPFTGDASTNWKGALLLSSNQSAGVLDALSTAFFLMGPEASETLRKAYAIEDVFYSATSIVASAGFTFAS